MPKSVVFGNITQQGGWLVVTTAGYNAIISGSAGYFKRRSKLNTKSPQGSDHSSTQGPEKMGSYGEFLTKVHGDNTDTMYDSIIKLARRL